MFNKNDDNAFQKYYISHLLQKCFYPNQLHLMQFAVTAASQLSKGASVIQEHMVLLSVVEYQETVNGQSIRQITRLNPTL